MLRDVEQGLRLLQKDPAFTSVLPEGRTKEAAALLEKYIAEIELFNPAYGLVGTSDREELVTKHILDSLAPLGIIGGLLGEHGGDAPQIADVGSGAGLPGIPLAIALPQARFTLIERMGRRTGFLRNTLAILGLDNVTVEEGEMEKAAPGRFDIICFRAFRPLEPAILRGLFRLLAPGGVLAAYKGRREAVEAEMAKLGEGAGPWKALPCPVPGLAEERCLLVIHPSTF
ncbi:MAG: 16S rRNA (guanine(527)-N(7))-methyltransferase RsmG [Treponema sp.]|jgi:16S rRNA (guanine527-N7)-methyltransferase|nr:16S rRNA (guanine(527)-N(7))-methyltransferase RsmG [Treponema sp.]